MVNYDHFSHTFSRSRKSLAWPEIDYFLEKYGDTIGEKDVCDIGCGSGRLLGYFETYLSYTGIDGSMGMLECAQNEHPERKNTTWIHGKMQDIDTAIQEGQKFDIIFFIASFHHLESREERIKTLKKTKKFLKKNGKVCLTNWNLLSGENEKKYHTSRRQEYPDGSADFDIKIGEHTRFYHGFHPDELVELYQLSGFEILENRVFLGEKNIISVLI